MAEYDVVENLLEGEPTGGVTIPDASTTAKGIAQFNPCLLYTSPSPRDS